ncbi:DUF2179 domain-containing protein [Metamycoplasma hominis]|uniref:DUF2179 domain-containing protein n=1 Tax=Metamycoplasma hominis TaxID=2098 RepID=UPI003CEBCFAA
MKHTAEELAEIKERKRLKKETKKEKGSVGKIDINPYGVNFFNIWKKFPKKMVMIIISAVLYNIGVATFLAKAATVATGLSALVQAITLTLTQTAPYFAYIYIAMNLPFVIAFWKKNSRLFMILTTYWLLWQVIFQSILLIPQVGHFFSQITFYYVNWYAPHSATLAPAHGEVANSLNVLIPWDVYGNYLTHYSNVWNTIKSTGFNPSWNNGILLNGVQLSYQETMSYWYFYQHLIHDYNNPTWPIIIFAVLGALCGGCAGGIAWKNSASTAGGDFVVYYISRTKQKEPGLISLIVAICFAVFSIVVISICELTGVISHAQNGNPINHAALLLRIICTFVYIFLYTFIMASIYPKYRKVKLEIYSKNPDLILNKFKEINYWHAYTIDRMLGGYTNTETVKIETYCLFLEQNMIKKEILAADSNAWITSSKVENVSGRFNTSKIEK